MKIHMDRDEFWPYMMLDKTYEYDLYEVPDELVKEWEELNTKVRKLQKKLKKIYDES